ncbi:hypothetical protein ACH5RR_003484 [Cinchona calisaya]|uniref:Uncharacterized protein n=1 Tax=Cinchona calisaya TaxID=153742 RepID=A0ABD3AVC8_9GENT
MEDVEMTSADTLTAITESEKENDAGFDVVQDEPVENVITKIAVCLAVATRPKQGLSNSNVFATLEVIEEESSDTGQMVLPDDVELMVAKLVNEEKVYDPTKMSPIVQQPKRSYRVQARSEGGKKKGGGGEGNASHN